MNTDQEFETDQKADKNYVSLDSDSSSTDASECVICLEELKPKTNYIFDCGHKLHRNCFHKYFSYHYDVEKNFISCPICRNPMEVSVERVQDSYSPLATVYVAFMMVVMIMSLTSVTMYYQFH